MVKGWAVVFYRIILFALLAPASLAQTLPKIELSPVFPEVTFNFPVWMEEAPDGSGRFFIVEQGGKILAVRRNGGSGGTKEFLNITDRKPHASYEQGLLGLAFHPGFKTNGLIYIHYNQQDPRRSVISEFKARPDDPDRAGMDSERIIMEVPQPSDVHKGGQITFGPDGFLYIGFGDGGGQSDPFNNAQNTASLLGKILRIDVNTRSTNAANKGVVPYGIPKDNPFVNEPELPDGPVRKEIWAYGLRNPWRFSWDRETRDLWVGDVGQEQWEEINLIVPGGNYGWCLREGRHRFKPPPENAQYIDPVIEYPHDPKLSAGSAFPKHTMGMCVIGGRVYRGDRHPLLRGVYVYADYALGTIWGIRYKDGQVAAQGTLLEQPKNITSFSEDVAGELYALSSDGHVFSIKVKKE